MKALQNKELEILKYLKKICVANNLKFFLGGGSSIGAIRHGGFIPWDDDVDVFMPREDYEKLYANWRDYSESTKYSLCRSDSEHNYRHAAMTINDDQTTFINFRTKEEDVNQGIAVDIIPMDHLADGFVARTCQRLNAIVFSIFINQRLPENQGKLLHFLTWLPLALIRSNKLRYKIWRGCEKRMVRYSKIGTPKMVELVTGLSAIYRPLESSWFETTIDKKFEDTKMPVPVGYDNYLKLIFGNYMELPDPKKRKAKHHTALIDTNNSYMIYKGKYYLDKKK
nr:LicD family protein [Lactobacillus sp. HBUAS51381]